MSQEAATFEPIQDGFCNRVMQCESLGACFQRWYRHGGTMCVSKDLPNRAFEVHRRDRGDWLPLDPLKRPHRSRPAVTVNLLRMTESNYVNLIVSCRGCMAPGTQDSAVRHLRTEVTSVLRGTPSLPFIVATCFPGFPSWKAIIFCSAFTAWDEPPQSWRQ